MRKVEALCVDNDLQVGDLVQYTPFNPTPHIHIIYPIDYGDFGIILEVDVNFEGDLNDVRRHLKSLASRTRPIVYRIMWLRVGIIQTIPRTHLKLASSGK